MTRPITVEYRAPRSWFQRTRGWMCPRRRLIVIYRHWAWDPIGIEVTRIQELAHASGRPGCAGHGRLFRRLLVREANRELGLGLDLGTADRCRSVAEVEGRIWRAVVRARVVAWARGFLGIGRRWDPNGRVTRIRNPGHPNPPLPPSARFGLS